VVPQPAFVLSLMLIVVYATRGAADATVVRSAKDQFIAVRVDPVSVTVRSNTYHCKYVTQRIVTLSSGLAGVPLLRFEFTRK
jgi:hypothetical protein